MEADNSLNSPESGMNSGKSPGKSTGMSSGLRRSLLMGGLALAGFLAWQVFYRPARVEKPLKTLHLIPQPSKTQVLRGGFVPEPGLTIYFSGEEAKAEASFLATWLPAYGLKAIPVKTIDPGQEPRQRILLQQVSDAGLGAEGYRISITEDGVDIFAENAAGFFYGTQTLRQLLDDSAIELAGLRIDEPDQYRLSLPACSISNQPAFAWRGLLLDASRHFWTPDQVKRVIDQLAYHKMNVLHWHLTDDQVWRLAIASRPELAEKASWRIEPDGSRYGGFYTAQQVQDIVAYAAERHVMVVPEIEMPGHSQAALAAYPELSCTGGPHKVWNDWGVSKEIFCAGNEATFVFLDEVLHEVIRLFPSPYIHLGGDEAPPARWEKCTRCQARRQELGLTDAHQLQSWFLRRIADSLALQGRTMIGWDEINDGEHSLLRPDAIVQAWRGMDKAEAAALAGHRVIVSPTSHAYFDYGLESIDLEQVFSFDPVPEALRETPQESLILGGAANAWSEHIPDQATLDDRLFPRLLAMAEVLWHGPGSVSWADFQTAIQAHYPRLDRMGIAYGAETVPLQFVSEANAGGWVDLRLVPGSADASIYFGEGRTVPDSTYMKFDTDTTEQAHLSLLDGDHVLTARAYRRSRPWGEPITREFRLHLATGQLPVLAHAWTEPYSGGGANALTDGRLGTDKFRDGIWQGYFGADLDATIDLGQTATIDSVMIGCFQYINAWIFLPKRILIYAGSSEENMVLTATVENPVSARDRNSFVRTFVATFTERPARFVRVVAENVGVCPSWHEAAGSPAWLFADEIAVR